MTGALAGKTISQVAAGYDYSLALTTDGSLYAWGTNGNGQLGNGTTTNSSVPVPVDTTGALAGKTITQIAVGIYYSFALTSDGSLYSWGYNGDGQLGNGTTTNSSVPVEVSALPHPALTGITFGGIPVTSFAILPNGNVSMVTSAHAAGPVDVVFAYADGRTTTIQNGFTYTVATTGGGTTDPATPTTPVAPDSGVAPRGNVALMTLVTVGSVLIAGIGGVIVIRTHRRR
jgi:hypothetical protein